jgi:hypothetical protein
LQFSCNFVVTNASEESLCFQIFMHYIVSLIKLFLKFNLFSRQVVKFSCLDNTNYTDNSSMLLADKIILFTVPHWSFYYHISVNVSKFRIRLNIDFGWSWWYKGHWCYIAQLKQSMQHFNLVLFADLPIYIIIPRRKGGGGIEIVSVRPTFRPSVLPSDIFVRSISQKVFEVSTWNFIGL